MTVCIAAIYQDDEDQQGIVFCADGRLSHNWAGSTDGNVKTFDIGHGWTSLIATDDWASAVSFRDHIREGWEKAATPSTKAEAHSTMMSIAKGFKKSPFHNKSAETDILLCGFVGTAPIILWLKMLKSALTLTQSHNFAAIGSGSAIATVFLNQRNCSPRDNRERAAYVVFEAKKCSEKDPGVGPAVTMGSILPQPLGCPTHACYCARFNRKGVQHLEGLYRSLCIQPIPKLADFPVDCYDLAE